jgi:hypothetical protein
MLRDQVVQRHGRPECEAGEAAEPGSVGAAVNLGQIALEHSPGDVPSRISYTLYTILRVSRSGRTACTRVRGFRSRATPRSPPKQEAAQARCSYAALALYQERRLLAGEIQWIRRQCRPRFT